MRPDTKTGLAWLPNVHENRIAWVEALARDWAEHDREAFEAILPWREETAWRTDRELDLAFKLEDLEARRAAALAVFDEESEQLDQALHEAAAAADAYERALLTTQDDELVQVVTQVFEELGFQVEDMDAKKKPGEAKLEDLRVQIPGDQAWTALVEVKGHGKRNLRMVDINKVIRHRNRFRDREGKWPSKVIVVHNGQAEKLPTMRQRPFETSPADAIALEEDGWLIIPTMDLFRLHRDRAKLDTKARRLIVESKGVLSYP